MSYQKVVQIGASGNVGKPIFESLVASGKFDITVVARHISTFMAPNNASVKVLKVDFGDHQALVNALKGNDAVALTFGDVSTIEKNSKAIIDAAIEAGVKRLIPSEYGVYLVKSPGREEPIFGGHVKVQDYLSEKSAEGAIEFTTIATGPFFDWGLTTKFFGFDIPAKNAIIYNGGNDPVNASTLETIGAAVVSVLTTPERFKNKHLRISDFYVSQNEVLAILEAETGSKFTIQPVDAEKLGEDSNAALGRGEYNYKNVAGAVLAAIFGQKSSTRWGQEDDTESLGIPKKDLTEEIRKVL